MIAVNAHKGSVFLFAFQLLDQVGNDGRIQQQDLISFILSCLDIAVLFLLVGSIEHDQFIVLIGLLVLDFFFQFVKSIILAVNSGIESKFLGFVKKFVFGQHSIFDDHLDGVPFLFKILAVVLE